MGTQRRKSSAVDSLMRALPPGCRDVFLACPIKPPVPFAFGIDQLPTQRREDQVEPGDGSEAYGSRDIPLPAPLNAALSAAKFDRPRR